jgi:hypothetical protein
MEINNSEQLAEAIALLQVEAEVKKTILQEQFDETYESLKPINLIKGAFNKIPAGGIAGAAIKTTLGLGVGILSKKLLVGKSTNIFKRAVGSVIKLAVAKVIAKNSDTLQAKGLRLVKKIIN